jgi:hypothetical protein
MKGIRFYEEFSNKRKGISENTVIAVLYVNGHNSYGYDAIGGTFPGTNSPVQSGNVNPEYLRVNCKRVSETRAREIHPNLFAFLDKEHP